MGFLKNMVDDLKRLLTDADSGKAKKEDIEERLVSLRALRGSLDLQWRKLEAEWNKASSVEANLKRTPLMRVQMLKRSKSIAQRMTMVGTFINMSETFIDILERVGRQMKHATDIRAAMGDVAAFQAMGDQVNTLMAQNKEVLNGLSNIQMQLENARERMSDIMTEAGDAEESARLTELYEKLETCQMKGDMEGAKAVQAEIATLATGGAALMKS